MELNQLAFDIGVHFHEEGMSIESVKDIGIEDIIADDKRITICCRRPGLLIGKRGVVIEALKKYLVSHDYTLELCIKETKERPILSNLYSVFYDDYYDDWIL